MVRSDYLLADGSPRYGIRTEETAEIPEATPEEAAPAVPAIRHIGGLDGTALVVAAAIRRRHLARFGRGAPLRALQRKHPEASTQAAAAVMEELGSVRAWRKALTKRFFEENDPQIDGRTALTVFGTLAIWVLVFAMTVTSAFLGARPLESGFLLLAGALASSMFYSSGIAGHGSVHVKDLNLLHQDAYIITLVEIIAANGGEVDPEYSADAKRAMGRFRSAEAAVQTLKG